jgi:aspartate-semialdehyde dehydrogenase
MEKKRVGVLGATGIVGQNYIRLLEAHPWFEVSYVAASPQSAGKSYRDAVAGRWHMPAPLPKLVAGLTVNSIDKIDIAVNNCDFVFSALDSGVAREYEEKYAAAGLPVVSNASAHRHTPDVPMLIPEINHDHTAIIPIQQKNRGWSTGFIAVKPNCSLQSYLTPLYVLHREFEVKRVIISTMQAISGAGYPGLAAIDMIDNIVPYIGGEEEKSEQEPMKILGHISGDQIEPIDSIKIAAHCNRVPAIDGHLATVSVELAKKPAAGTILQLWREFSSLPQQLDLPFAPNQPIIYRDEPNRPQTRLDRDNDKGMAVTVGRLRDCPVFDFRFVGLSHNTVRGAAGGGILNAELLYKQGFIK